MRRLIRWFLHWFRNLRGVKPRQLVETIRTPRKPKPGRSIKPAKGYAYNPLLEWPVNAQCPCSSGKKFKVCCKRGVKPFIRVREAKLLRPIVDKTLRQFGRSRSTPKFNLG